MRDFLINLSPCLMYIWACVLELCVYVWTFCGGVAAILPTCRPAESQLPLRHSSSPHAPRLPIPLPSPPCFSLNQGWHHHGGTHGPPHLLPITALQTPPQKRLQTVMKLRGTTWDLEKTSLRRALPTVGLARCGSVCDHLTTLYIRGLRGYYQRQYSECGCGRCSDIASEV